MVGRKAKFWAVEEPEDAPQVVETCPLCDRPMEAGDGDRHHLIPRHKGGDKGPTAIIHRFCHTKIHSVFTNSELARSYNTIEALRSHPEIERFITWVKDKPSSFYMKNDEAKGRRKKR